MHDKTKTAESTITSPTNEYEIKRSKVKVTGSKNAKGDRVAGVIYARTVSSALIIIITTIYYRICVN